ncbi:hypothetical protein D3C76_1816490 [compost metagenome]
MLVKIKNSQHSSDVFTKLGDPEFDSAVEAGHRYQYINGIHPARVASGRLVLDIDHRFGISEAGEQFINLYNQRNHH